MVPCVDAGDDGYREASGYTPSTLGAEVPCFLVEDGCSGDGPRMSMSELAFFDNFNGGHLDSDWDLDDEWSVRDHSLRGLGHSSADLMNNDVSNFDFRADFKRNRGGIHFNFRLTHPRDGLHRYYVDVSENELSLKKQLGQGNFIIMVVSELNYPDWERWHEIEIEADGGNIRVYLNGHKCICYKDPNPINSGRISFEVLPDSEFLIDDVTIYR